MSHADSESSATWPMEKDMGRGIKRKGIVFLIRGNWEDFNYIQVILSRYHDLLTSSPISHDVTEVLAFIA